MSSAETFARVAESAYAPALETGAERREGSSPSARTKKGNVKTMNDERREYHSDLLRQIAHDDGVPAVNPTHETRSVLTAAYNAAEYRYMAAVCLRKAISERITAGGPAEGFRRALATEKEAERELDLARGACEAAGIATNTHAARAWL